MNFKKYRIVFLLCGESRQYKTHSHYVFKKKKKEKKSYFTLTELAAPSWAHRQEYWTVPGTVLVCNFCPPFQQTSASCPAPVAALTVCRWAGTCPPPHTWCCTAAAGCCLAAESPAASERPETINSQSISVWIYDITLHYWIFVLTQLPNNCLTY